MDGAGWRCAKDGWRWLEVLKVDSAGACRKLCHASFELLICKTPASIRLCTNKAVWYHCQQCKQRVYGSLPTCVHAAVQTVCLTSSLRLTANVL